MLGINFLLFLVVLTLGAVKCEGHTHGSGVKAPSHRTNVSINYFDFSPELKLRQCQRMIDLMKICNVHPMYYKLPEITVGMSRALMKTIDYFFQVIIYKELYAVSGNYSSTNLPVFCRRGYCLECLLKNTSICRPSGELKPEEGYGDDYRQCMSGLTDDVAKDDGSICLTGVCEPGTPGYCQTDLPKLPSKNPRISGCTNSSSRGRNCYYVQLYTRTKMLDNGHVIDGVTPRSITSELLISLLWIAVFKFSENFS